MGRSGGLIAISGKIIETLGVIGSHDRFAWSGNLNGVMTSVTWADGRVDG